LAIEKRCLPWLLIPLLLLSSYGCRTTTTAAHETGQAVSDTAAAAGHTVGVAADGAADIVEKTADEADDELD